MPLPENQLEPPRTKSRNISGRSQRGAILFDELKSARVKVLPSERGEEGLTYDSGASSPTSSAPDAGHDTFWMQRRRRHYLQPSDVQCRRRGSRRAVICRMGRLLAGRARSSDEHHRACEPEPDERHLRRSVSADGG